MKINCLNYNEKTFRDLGSGFISIMMKKLKSLFLYWELKGTPYKMYIIIAVAIIYFISMTLYMHFEHPLIEKMDNFLLKHEMLENLFLIINVPLYFICCIYLFLGFVLLLNELLIFLKLDSRK